MILMMVLRYRKCKSCDDSMLCFLICIVLWVRMFLMICNGSVSVVFVRMIIDFLIFMLIVILL